MKIIKVRLIFISVLLALCFSALIGRLFYIQILNGKKFAIRCREQSKRRTLLTARRGFIRDRKGHVLAKSVSIKRVYPFGELAGPVLGYVGTDGNGLAGVEYTFDRYLKGENGWSIIQKDGRNKRYSRIGMPKKAPQNGCDVYLTIDVEIQKIAEKVLAATLKKCKASGGMCIVMDPVCGDVLAMVNAPAFNPNVWKQYPSECRKNRCVTINYEPGSTFKVVTAAAALQEGVKKEEDKINGDQGIFEIYDQTIRDYKPFGILTFSEALCYSRVLSILSISGPDAHG
jgi:cell division protein FtsI/penicillin-binding protein 2